MCAGGQPVYIPGGFFDPTTHGDIKVKAYLINHLLHGS